ncbi:MAG: SDR family oxidoreductase [Acidobacteria bacterium]|nr:SDR family oxidoreductase [Acidobacteriota bacterium]
MKGLSGQGYPARGREGESEAGSRPRGARRGINKIRGIRRAPAYGRRNSLSWPGQGPCLPSCRFRLLAGMELRDRVALITGGKRIGTVVATELARRGADVALVYRTSRAEAEETAVAIGALGRRAAVIGADLAMPEAAERVVHETVGQLGRLDVLVNMASTYQMKAFDDLDEADWDRQMTVDLRAAWLCARAAVPHMRRVRGGRIINVSDWVARSGRPRYRGYLPYYVAKAGIIALTEALALELASDQILVNAVAPGPIVAPEGTSDEEFAAVERATPLGRWGGEIEIAKTVLALIESDFITGETIRVDGGRHLK